MSGGRTHGDWRQGEEVTHRGSLINVVLLALCPNCCHGAVLVAEGGHASYVVSTLARLCHSLCVHACVHTASSTGVLYTSVVSIRNGHRSFYWS